MKILMLDPDSSWNVVMEMLKKPLGFDLHTEADLPTGFQMIHDLKPDLLIVDIYRQPDGQKAGIILLETIKKSNSFPDMMIAIVTNEEDISQGEDQRKALDAGAIAYLQKPLDRYKVTELLGRVIVLKKKK